MTVRTIHESPKEEQDHRGSDTMLKKAEQPSKNHVDEDSSEQDGNEDGDIFGGLLGAGNEMVSEIRAKKMAKKKEIINKMTNDSHYIQAFQAYDTVIKSDPLHVMKQLAKLKQRTI